MANVASMPSPQRTIQRVDWQNLVKAHTLVRQCQVVQGIQQYKRLLLNHFARYFYEGRWSFSDDSAEPSLNWACVYLAEYYMKERVWADWLDLYALIAPHQQRFSPLCQSRLIAIYGWAQMFTASARLETLLEQQTVALELPDLSDYAKGHHYILMGIAYRRQKKTDKALVMMHRAVECFSIETEPYYAILARDYFASTCSTYQRDFPEYAHIAQKTYAEIATLIVQFGEDAETEQQNYSQGWHYLEKANPTADDAQLALQFFERGEQITAKHGLIFEQHLNRYGKSVAYWLLREYDRAIAEASAALKVFWSNGSDLLPTMLSRSMVSATYTAICLRIIAIAYHSQGMSDTALTYALRALPCHEHFNLPIENNHLYGTLAQIYTQLGQADEAAKWAGKIQ